MIISLFKKGDQEDPGNYRGITLLNVVGKLFNKVLNYRLLQWLEEHNKLSESQAGFRFNCSCYMLCISEDDGAPYLIS